MVKKIWITFLFATFAWVCFAQRQDTIVLNHNSLQNTLNANIVDSLAINLLQKNQQPELDTVSGINYAILPDRSFFMANPLFIDLVFTGLNVKFTPPPAPVVAQMEKKYLSFGEPVASYFNPAFSVIRYTDSLRNWEKNQLMMANPAYFKYDIESLPNPEQFTAHVINIPRKERLKLEHRYELNVPDNMKVAKLIKSPWMTSGSVLGQLSQNLTSSNWYQGGQSNVAGLFILTADANYDQKNIQFDNDFTYHMGIQSEAADSIRGYSVTDNLIRLSSKFGVKAFDNWYYSLSGQLTTYSLTSFSALNSITKMNGFFSPYQLDLGVGMNYNKNKLSFLITPLTYRYIHVANTTNFNLALYGIKPGQNSLREFGSSFLVNYEKQLSNYVDVSTRLYYFTNYHSMQLDWETIANVTINRFFSARISIHPRFDNSSLSTNGVYPKPWQFKELLSFGFAYQFTNLYAKKQ
ncbi:DUF3078 domain-containing protein [Microbacter margulisiae]|uniref:DUF3078 domain-containing protein n=1 Tax=Microbacter margulisiae TaxID=1350067 RepID=A0A7W5DRU4_9PORP|nr:DUF3078 domain-containing protein [Microbacter margulisiae]MBB3187583.1 hypothetical protein [Microbacter margulisiae]